MTGIFIYRRGRKTNKYFLNNIYIFGEKPAKINDALDHAREQDVLVVLAAGNSNNEIVNIFRNRDHIIIVGASSKNDTRWTVTTGGITQGSNWGKLLDVCAPVEDLVICQPSDSRFYRANDSPMGAEEIPFSGNICDVMPMGATSGAAPIVTSLAALVYSIAPDITAKEVKKAILEGCDDIDDKGVDIYTGYGRVNFRKTLSLVTNHRKQ
ncbi:MAG: S8 family serine peptidase [Bacteroides sp.]|nr:S8 family serine peptidase [Bacteroides sp.]